jgi:hypothetical protein
VAEVIYESLLSSLEDHAIIGALRHSKICSRFDQIANFIVFSPTIIYNVVEVDIGAASSQWTRFSIGKLYPHERRCSI